jgi:ribA/ribD-fused uncharacterized protein
MKAEIRSFSGAYEFLSNFYYVAIQFEGEWYLSVENAYQAAKSLVPAQRERFREVGPGGAKRLGRQVTLRPDWEEVKEEVMLELLRKKFAYNGLRLQLLETGNAQLIEDNTWGDTYWGVCGGKGRNRLGVLLMQVREELRQSNKSDK